MVVGFERKGKAWKKIAGEIDLAEGAKRGADGKTKYIKLSAEEKQTAVQIDDSVLQQGHSARQALQHMQTSVLRFANVSASSSRRGKSRSRPRRTTKALTLSQPPAAMPLVAERLQWSHKKFEPR